MSIDLGKLKEKAAALQAYRAKTSRDLNFWKPSTGTMLIRVLPPTAQAAGLYFRDTAYHYNVGPEEKTFVCLRAEGKVCPICELRDQLYATKNPQLAELAGDLVPKPKVYFNMIDRKHPELGVQIGTLTGKYAVEGVHEAILGYCLDPQWGDLTDPTYGRDITIEKKGSGLDSEYQVRPSPVPSPIYPDAEAQQAVLSQLKDLDKIVKYTAAEEMITELAEVQELAMQAGMPALKLPTEKTLPKVDAKPEIKPQPVVKEQPSVNVDKGRKFWIVNEKGEVVEALESAVIAMVEKGRADFPCMLLEETVWKTPALYGIKPKPPAAPPKPPAPPKPAAPSKPQPPAAPAALAQAPEKPAAKPTPSGSAVTIPEEKKVCFGLKYDSTKDDCQMCPYEAFCISTTQATKQHSQ